MTSNSSSSAAVRFVIVGFDGLRPDSVEADMPALSHFMASNHSWSHYLADFPTETYVNHPGIFSGFRRPGHGLVANCYWRRDMGGADGVFFGFDLEHVLRHRREDGLLLVPTMGERLGAAGKTMRVYCANSKGSTRLQHLYADRYPDHVCACVHDLVTSVPDNERRELVEDFGPGVPLEFPDFRGTKLVVDLFFERELPRGLGDVTVLWIGEPTTPRMSSALTTSAPARQGATQTAIRARARVVGDGRQGRGRAARRHV